MNTAADSCLLIHRRGRGFAHAGRFFGILFSPYFRIQTTLCITRALSFPFMTMILVLSRRLKAPENLSGREMSRLASAQFHIPSLSIPQQLSSG
jgi:hypothetical protein